MPMDRLPTKEEFTAKLRELRQKESKKAAETYVHAIQAAFNDRLTELDWMDPATKDKARAKLKTSNSSSSLNIAVSITRRPSGVGPGRVASFIGVPRSLVSWLPAVPAVAAPPQRRRGRRAWRRC